MTALSFSFFKNRQRSQRKIFRTAGFSLVEVVLSLGIISFAGMGLLGLFSLGINVNRDSIEELEATHLIESTLGARRAAPNVDVEATAESETAALLLPRLDQGAVKDKTAPLFLTSDGRLAPSEASSKYGMTYEIAPSADGNTSGVYVCLFWPSIAGADRAHGKVEIFTVVSLP